MSTVTPPPPNEARDLETIRAAAAELAKHPRFRGKMFGPVQALEVLYCLSVFLDKQPLPVKWPQAAETLEIEP